MSKTTITIELSPDIFIAMKSLSAFYRKSDAELIEMSIELLASDAKVIVETINAQGKGEEEK